MARKAHTAAESVAPMGWIPRQRTRRITPEGDYWEPQDGAEPIWVEVAANLSFDECDAIPLGDAQTYLALHTAIAPYVVGWNVCGRNLETRQYERLPAPAEAGPDVFRAVPDRLLVLWLGRELKYGPLPVGDQKKESTATGDTDGG